MRFSSGQCAYKWTEIFVNESLSQINNFFKKKFADTSYTRKELNRVNKVQHMNNMFPIRM